MKNCTSCLKYLPFEAYYRDTRHGNGNGRCSQCIECTLVKGRLRYRVNKETIRLKVIEYRKANPEKVKHWRHKQNQTPHTKEYRRIYQLNYRKLHPDRVKATEQKRNQTEKRRQSFRTKEYRRKGAIGDHTLGEWLAKLAEYRYTCAYCDNAGTTRDHKIPIVRGGTNFIDNIVPACFSCNSSKGRKTDDEYILWKKTSSRTRLYAQSPTN